MKRAQYPGCQVAALLVMAGSLVFAQDKAASGVIPLPPPALKGATSIEEGLNARRSTRAFTADPIKLAQISQIVWAGQGITRPNQKPSTFWLPKYEYQGGYRTTPSAGALFPMELYVVAANVEGLEPAVYKYVPKTHSLKKVLDGNKIMAVYDAALKQDSIKMAQALIVIAGVVERPTAKYRERAERYMQIEVGAVCQNVYLQSGALGLGTVMIGAFRDDLVKQALQLPAEEAPLGIMPIGKPKPE